MPCYAMLLTIVMPVVPPVDAAEPSNSPMPRCKPLRPRSAQGSEALEASLKPAGEKSGCWEQPIQKNLCTVYIYNDIYIILYIYHYVFMCIYIYIILCSLYIYIIKYVYILVLYITIYILESNKKKRPNQ